QGDRGGERGGRGARGDVRQRPGLPGGRDRGQRGEGGRERGGRHSQREAAGAQPYRARGLHRDEGRAVQRGEGEGERPAHHGGEGRAAEHAAEHRAPQRGGQRAPGDDAGGAPRPPRAPRPAPHGARPGPDPPSPRHSSPTPRTISAARTASSGRYQALSRPEYQPGNAANIAPTAVMSQTSLPSHTGPIVASTWRRSASSRASSGSSAPTPKSKPSSTK